MTVKIEFKLKMKSTYLMKNLYLTEVTEADEDLSSLSIRNDRFFFSKINRDETSIKTIKDLLEIKEFSASEVTRGIGEYNFDEIFFNRLKPCWIRKSFLEICQKGYGLKSIKDNEFEKLVKEGFQFNFNVVQQLSNYIIDVNIKNLSKIQGSKEEYVLCYKKNEMLFDENFKCILYMNELEFLEEVKEHKDFPLLLKKLLEYEEQIQILPCSLEEKEISKERIKEFSLMKNNKIKKVKNESEKIPNGIVELLYEFEKYKNIKKWKFPIKSEKYDEVLTIFKDLDIDFIDYLEFNLYKDRKEAIYLPIKIALVLQEPQLFDIVFSEGFSSENRLHHNYEKIKIYLHHKLLDDKLNESLINKKESTIKSKMKI